MKVVFMTIAMAGVGGAALTANASEFERRAQIATQARAEEAVRNNQAEIAMADSRLMEQVNRLGTRHGGVFNLETSYYGHELPFSQGRIAKVVFNTGDGHACRYLPDDRYAGCYDSANKPVSLAVPKR